MRYLYILIMLAAIEFSACNHQKHEHHKEALFSATNPTLADTTIFNEYVCQIHSIQHIELRALEKGYLQKIYVDEGQKVKQGQLLFQIMPVVYRAEMQKAQAEADFASVEYHTTKSLADSNIVSKNELALAKAKFDKAKAELALAQAHLGFTEIRAPFDGIVGRFNDVRLGSLVDEGELLTTLSDNSKMWVYFNVPETEYLHYINSPEGLSKRKVRLQMANNKFFEKDGVVETIEADFNNETGNIAFRATFDNPKGVLRNGETGNIWMPVSLQKALLIPQKTTFEVLDKKYVYVVSSKGVLEAREIKTGAELPHLYEVVSGLHSNDKILVDGLRKVKNGQKVRYSFRDFWAIAKELETLHAE